MLGRVNHSELVHQHHTLRLRTAAHLLLVEVIGTLDDRFGATGLQKRAPVFSLVPT